MATRKVRSRAVDMAGEDNDEDSAGTPIDDDDDGEAIL